MRIAVLGSGNMGAALGHLFGAAGHTVTFIYSRDPAKLERLARRNGAQARAPRPERRCVERISCCSPCTGARWRMCCAPPEVFAARS